LSIYLKPIICYAKINNGQQPPVQSDEADIFSLIVRNRQSNLCLYRWIWTIRGGPDWLWRPSPVRTCKTSDRTQSQQPQPSSALSLPPFLSPLPRECGDSDPTTKKAFTWGDDGKR